MPLDGTDQHDAPLDGQVEHRYTILEAARLLNVHKNTIRHRVRTGVYTAESVLTPHGEAFVIPAHYIDAELAAIASGQVKARGQGTAQGYDHPRVSNDGGTLQLVPQEPPDISTFLALYTDQIQQAAQELSAPIQQELEGAKKDLGTAQEEVGRLKERAAQLTRDLEAERRKTWWAKLRGG